MHNDEQHYVKEKDGVEMPSAKFKRLVLKTMKSAAGDQQVTNILERLERKCGSVIAEVVRVELDTLRNDRVSKAADWVSQLSSTEVFCKSLDCQFLYSCLLCGLLPARNASWYLLKRPNTKPFWVCARCGHEWAGKNRGRILVVKVSGEKEAVLCKIPDNVPKEQHGFFCQLENEISLLRLAHVARKLQPGDPSTEEIIAAIGALAAGSEQRMQDYHRMFQQEATHAYKENTNPS